MKSNGVKAASECRVLIVDDEKSIADMLSETLKDTYIVDACYSADDAFRNIKKTEYDVIVTDLKLGDGSGIDVLRLAKEYNKYTEVIIITGFGTLETASEAINSGVTSYLNKPLKINDFILQVDRAVASRLFHLRSLQLMNHADEQIPAVKDHILDITSLYYFTSKLMFYLDISEVMRIILEEINEKLDVKFSVIGINYLRYNEIFAMPREGEVSSAEIMDSILSVWDDSFKIFEKEDFKSKQISFYVYRGRESKFEKNHNTSYGSVVCLPMSVLGETIGFIALYRESKEPLSNERNQFFCVFTSLISSAVQHCYMDMLAKQQAKTDSLTGVANHRLFHETLDREVARARRYRRHFCLAILDIDDFKKINDTYGHLVGDGVLIDLTRRILKLIRCGDVLARYGGEEFGIVLPDTDIDGAEKLSRRVCTTIAEEPFVFSDTRIQYTVSMGLVKFDYTNPLGKDKLISHADDALYQAKREGKNRVIINK